MFECLSESAALKIKVLIGSFVFNTLRLLKDSETFSEEKINNLDRIKLAENFIRNNKHNFDIYADKLSDFTDAQFLNNIAEFIDFKIPYRYWLEMRLTQRENPDPNLYPGIKSLKN